jgi:hypothetical protein
MKSVFLTNVEAAALARNELGLVVRPVTCPEPWMLEDDGERVWFEDEYGDSIEAVTACQVGRPGERLWVREGWRVGAWDCERNGVAVDYRVDGAARKEWLFVEDAARFERLSTESWGDAMFKGLAVDEEGGVHWKEGEAPTRWRSGVQMSRAFSRFEVEVVSVGCRQAGSIDAGECWDMGLRVPRPLGADVENVAFPSGFEGWSDGRRDRWYKGQARATYIAQCCHCEDYVTEFQRWMGERYGRLFKRGWERDRWCWFVNVRRVDTTPQGRGLVAGTMKAQEVDEVATEGAV